MNTRTKLLGSLVVAAFLSFGNPAFADSYTGTVSVYVPTAGEIVQLNGNSENAGEILLTGNGTGAYNGVAQLATWCLDIYHSITIGSSYTWNIVQPIINGLPYTPPSGNPPLSTTGLTASQINIIGALMQWAATGTNLSTAHAPAAIQLAIWNVEYGFSMAGTNAAILNLATNYINYATNQTNGFTWFSNWALLVKTGGQDLGFIPPPGHEIFTPLPGALPLFATGLGVLAFVTRRKKKKAATAAA